ncbi:hypothetical protein CARUB_v10015936mg [Capsella rubella]|uniref:F-box domain-containing protein n=1 Tax=Capsella rubella TaxID=81985 RepID=R0GAP9_9BRAS|nr:putative F-box protein At3g13830 [Capsella rubella]EOA32641.1 hypothetical protein CARUB_v10015936mg [Capsella rubella]
MTTTTTTIANLPEVLVEEIVSRVPVTSLGPFRSTCKKWEALSRTHLLGAAATATKQLIGFVVVDYSVCSMKLDVHGIINTDGNGIVDLSVNQVGEFDGIEIAQLLHCDGLLLCVLNDNVRNSRLIVCNLYLGETRSIKPNHVLHRFHRSGVFGFGYDDGDRNKNRNHKILRSKPVGGGYEIYSFRTDRWRDVEDSLDEYTQLGPKQSLSFKGNAYFLATKESPVTLEVGEEGIEPIDSIETRDVLLCFNFTTETFGEPLPLPFNSEDDVDNVALTCVRDEKLAVLYQSYKSIGIWISTMTEPNAALWTKFLEVDLIALDGFPGGFTPGSFFIDEEKHVAILFDRRRNHPKANIIGEDGAFKSLNVGYHPPRDFVYYVPSLVSVKINKPSKRKERDH